LAFAIVIKENLLQCNFTLASEVNVTIKIEEGGY